MGSEGGAAPAVVSSCAMPMAAPKPPATAPVPPTPAPGRRCCAKRRPLLSSAAGAAKAGRQGWLQLEAVMWLAAAAGQPAEQVPRRKAAGVVVSRCRWPVAQVELSNRGVQAFPARIGGAGGCGRSTEDLYSNRYGERRRRAGCCSQTGTKRLRSGTEGC